MTSLTSLAAGKSALRFRPWLLVFSTSALVAATVGAAFAWRSFSDARQLLPYYAHFDKSSADHWTAYGGTWEVRDGSMRNDSDERGAKLVTGSPDWKDYSIDADLELLGAGDAGLIARVADPEVGVDSYSGYYAGLRTVDNSLVIGRVRHAFQSYEPKPMPSGVEPLRWYHLQLLVSGCRITATATDRRKGQTTSLSIHDPECFPSGRIGLRSYSSGGVWRRVIVAPIGKPAPLSVAQSETVPPSDPFGVLRPLRGSYLLQSSRGADDTSTSVHSAPAVPINSLRLMAASGNPAATVRGTVVLTAPSLYVEDPSGGVEVRNASGPPLKVGDEVEVTGGVEPHDFSSVLNHARVRLLWEGEPLPPFAVTLNQAATGAYDSMFIELDGMLVAKDSGPDNSLALSLAGGSQAFRAVTNPGRSQALFRNLRRHSLLRLRGVCTVDPRYTHNLNPFVLLVRSAEDVEVISGPPWWSFEFLRRILFGTLVALLLGYVVYLRARHWRLCAVLEERGRLAHEMHDTLAQSFAGIGFQLQAIQNRIPEGSETLRADVEVARVLVRHSHDEARRSIAALRSETPLAEGLLPALKNCAEHMVGLGSVLVTLNSPVAPKLIRRIEDTLFRIGQEAIANALRHAQPKHLSIALVCRRTSATLVIEDDGVGFDTSQPALGFGVLGMRKRAEAISAEVTLVSSPGAGTRVEVVVPLPDRWTLANWPKLISSAIRGITNHGSKRADPYSYR